MLATVAGYSGTPLALKLGICQGARLALLEAPPGFEALLAPLPGGVTVLRRAASNLDVAVLFVTCRARLEQRFSPVASVLRPAGALWVAWPKRSSGVLTDVDENVLREVGLPTGMVDNKVCAIDEVWSGLRFVWRRQDRPPAAPGRL